MRRRLPGSVRERPGVFWRSVRECPGVFGSVRECPGVSWSVSIPRNAGEHLIHSRAGRRSDPAQRALECDVGRSRRQVGHHSRARPCLQAGVCYPQTSRRIALPLTSTFPHRASGAGHRVPSGAGKLRGSKKGVVGKWAATRALRPLTHHPLVATLHNVPSMVNDAMHSVEQQLRRLSAITRAVSAPHIAAAESCRILRPRRPLGRQRSH